MHNMGIDIKVTPSTDAPYWLDSIYRQTEFSMGERLQATAQCAPGGFGEQLAATGVSIDDLFDPAPKRRSVKQEGDRGLRRRLLLAVEKLGVPEKRQMLQLLDAFIERGQLRRKAESRA